MTVYEINKELEKYVNSCSDNFAKFQMCENLKHPITVTDFWPILFEYRGNETLKLLHEDICHDNAVKVLYSILSDGYNFYGISSISIRNEAFVLKNSQMFPISQYRTPTTHLQIHEKNLRVDRPVFLVEKDRSSTKISLHPVFLQILPPPHTITTISDDNDDSMSISNSQDFMDEDSRKFISDMFSQVSIEGEDQCVTMYGANNRTPLQAHRFL